MPATHPAGERAALPQLSLVIVTWNSGDELLGCLESLVGDPPAARIEVIVVDNGSTDGSIERVRADHPHVRVIQNRRNRGLAAANNQGIVASSAPFVLISNPDVLYRASAIDALLKLMERRPRAALAVARLTHPDGAVQTAAGDLPSLFEALIGRRLTARAHSGPSGMWWHGWPHDEERTIGHGAEACYLARRAAVAEVGLQDEGYVLDWEGIEWSRRFGQAGWEIWFCPQAAVVHIGGTSLAKARSRWVVSTHRGMYRYFRDQLPVWARPVLLLSLLGRAALKITLLHAGSSVYQAAHRAESPA